MRVDIVWEKKACKSWSRGCIFRWIIDLQSEFLIAPAVRLLQRILLLNVRESCTLRHFISTLLWGPKRRRDEERFLSTPYIEPNKIFTHQALDLAD